jgi:dTDP-4-amino-4,6-dideoxygalactose transaminase
MSATRVSVPFVDLRPLHEPLRAAILADVEALLASGAFVNGEAVAAFETEFAAFVGARECVGMASGLDALRLALLAAGIEPGDEVLVPAQTFVATFEAVTQAGGTPVPVDVSERDFNIDAAAAEAAVTGRTRFVLPVHLYGQLADMRAVLALRERHDLVVIEDACQAHGAFRDGIAAGAAGNLAAFSFYPAKNLGALGDAGAAVTNDSGLAARLRALREHGQTGKYVHEVEGYTARLDTIQALALSRKLPLLREWNEQRRAAAAHYLDELEGVAGIELPPVPDGSEPVWHLFVITTADPDGLAASLAENSVATGRHYPTPPHLTAAYAGLGLAQGSFPVAERLARTALSLPLYPGITEGQVSYVAERVKAFVGG